MAAREDAIAKGKASLDQAQSDAFGVAFDAGVASVPAAPAPDADVQSQIDAAVKSAVDARAGVDSAALEQVQGELAKAQADLDAETKLESADQVQLAGQKAMLDKIQAIFAAASAPAAQAPAADQPAAQ